MRTFAFWADRRTVAYEAVLGSEAGQSKYHAQEPRVQFEYAPDGLS